MTTLPRRILLALPLLITSIVFATSSVDSHTMERRMLDAPVPETTSVAAVREALIKKARDEAFMASRDHYITTRRIKNNVLQPDDIEREKAAFIRVNLVDEKQSLNGQVLMLSVTLDVESIADYREIEHAPVPNSLKNPTDNHAVYQAFCNLFRDNAGHFDQRQYTYAVRDQYTDGYLSEEDYLKGQSFRRVKRIGATLEGKIPALKMANLMDALKSANIAYTPMMMEHAVYNTVLFLRFDAADRLTTTSEFFDELFPVNASNRQTHVPEFCPSTPGNEPQRSVFAPQTFYASTHVPTSRLDDGLEDSELFLGAITPAGIIIRGGKLKSRNDPPSNEIGVDFSFLFPVVHAARAAKNPMRELNEGFAKTLWITQPFPSTHSRHNPYDSYDHGSSGVMFIKDLLPIPPLDDPCLWANYNANYSRANDECSKVDIHSTPSLHALTLDPQRKILERLTPWSIEFVRQQHVTMRPVSTLTSALIDLPFFMAWVSPVRDQYDTFRFPNDPAYRNLSFGNGRFSMIDKLLDANPYLRETDIFLPLFDQTFGSTLLNKFNSRVALARGLYKHDIDGR